MDFAELKSSFDACRAGLYSPSGREEASPLRGPVELTHRIAIRRADEPPTILEAPWQSTVAIAFSSDGRYLAAAGRPGGVCVWNVATSDLVAHYDRPQAWRLRVGVSGLWCLPVRFAAGDRYLLIGGRELSVATLPDGSFEPIVDFPVVALTTERESGDILIVGPDEEGSFPVEALELSTFSLSARAPVPREDHTTTIFLGS